MLGPATVILVPRDAKSSIGSGQTRTRPRQVCSSEVNVPAPSTMSNFYSTTLKGGVVVRGIAASLRLWIAVMHSRLSCRCRDRREVPA